MKNKQGKFQDEELPHEFFSTTRQATKTRNGFAKNMSTYMKLSKTQISKLIQSGGFFASRLKNLGNKALTNVAIPSDRDSLLGLASNLTSNSINTFEGKISGKGAVRSKKGFTLFTSTEDMSDIIKIIKSLED